MTVSIPLEQGSVLRHMLTYIYGEFLVSIPLEQGSVLRQFKGKTNEHCRFLSQSLWNRAVSYDL